MTRARTIDTGWSISLRRVLCLAVLLVGVGAAQANGLRISNIILTGQNTTSDFILVQFNITWDNGWRTTSAPNNWDAAWVFVKYRVGSEPWAHATLETSGHTAPSGSMIDTPGDAVGVFIYRDADGTGTVTFSNVQLRWDYAADGLAGNTDIDVQVFGIEMVYVPQGSFELGSGGTETDHFYEQPSTGQTYTVSSEGTITVGTSSGDLYYSATENGGDQMGPIPAAFPKGFAAFYIQKYEISQGQYVAFLNTLTYDQQDTRTAVAPDEGAGTRALSASNRNAIEIQTPGVARMTPAVYANDFTDDGLYDQNDDGQTLACNYLSWGDGAAYADWSGLRPMTELEYEKASRGTQAPLADEYAWGSTSLHGAVYTITDDGQADATVNAGSATGNASYDVTDGSIDGPLRVGIFAASIGSPTRVESGATYYGVMEMSGNVREHPVTIGHATGRSFTGAHGNGALTSVGNADTSMWPGTDAVGAGFRGGAWHIGSTVLRVSSRSIAASTFAGRSDVVGFRAVRSAP